MNKLTYDRFVTKSNLKYDNFYKYPDININSNQKLKIICPIHGDFYQYPHHHLLSKIPCKNCRKELSIKNEMKKFLELSNNIHNNYYDYSKMIYKNNKIKIEIICPIHGSFFQRPDMHMFKKHGCPLCYTTSLLDKETFITKSNYIHNNYYDYSLIDKLSKFVNIICPRHNIFKQNIYNHLNGQGCPNCNNSKGENKVEQFLIKNNIKYVKQKKFDKCIFKRSLPFDFYLPDYNICIEYDGKYHFNNDEYIKNNDNIKTQFCENNNIKLIRFNLSNIKDIEKIINDICNI